MARPGRARGCSINEREDHVTVESQVIKARYEGNGVGREFPTQFAFLEDGHVLAVLRSPAPGTPAGHEDALLALGRDYSLSGAGNPGGGTLVMPVAPAEGQILTICSNVPPTQERAWNNMDIIDTAEIEKSHDKLTRICLQLKEELGRCVKYAVSDPDPGADVDPAVLLAARDTALAARNGALASEAAALGGAQQAGDSAAVSASSAAVAVTASEEARQLRDAVLACETHVANLEHLTEQYSFQAFAATAPAWNPSLAYSFPEVVAYTDGHSYRAVADVVGEVPPASSKWQRVTVGYGELFEQDDDGDIVPAL